MLAGITPAYAGKTYLEGCFRQGNRDHPRVCGENDSTALKAEADAGSPPRMRGKLHEVKVAEPNHGITPAYAGKTAVNSLRSQVR